MSKEIIEKIEEVEEFTPDQDKPYNVYEGYLIHTNVKTYHLLIEAYQSCCESFGYLSSDDNFEDYIGAELLSIAYVQAVEGEFKNRVISCAVDADYATFITLETSKGTLQFAVYNCHNGYYGHTVLIKVSDTEESMVL